ncbi:nitrate- and nitrite sensing domain-containing protein [Planomonospora algeriensis]
MSTQKTRDGGFRLRNWRVRSRLIALILVPTAAAVLLGGVQVFGSVRAAAEYQRVNDLARLSDHIGALTHELAAERDRTAWFIALGRPKRGEQGVRDQVNAVDGAAVRVRESGALLREAVGGRTGDEIEAALARLDDLAQLRRQALEEALLPDAAIDAYSLVIADLLSLHDELGKGSSDDLLFGQSLTLDALARAKESLSLQRGLLSVVLVAGRFEQEQMERFLGALASEQSERRAFAAEAGVAERRFFDETVNGGGADRAGFLRELVLLRAASGAPLQGLDLARKDDAGQWYEAVSATIDRMRAVEDRHARQIVARSGELGDAERNRALLAAGSVAGLLLAVLLITSGVARSLVRPLRRLRREALEVAGERLPQYVQRVRESRDGELGELAVEVPRSGSCPATRSARWPGPSTRSTGRPYGWRATRRSCATRSTRCSSTSPAGARRWWSASSPWWSGWSAANATTAAWPTCSSSTTWPPACAATARTCSSWPGRRWRAAGATRSRSWTSSAPRSRRWRTTTGW